MGEAAPQAADGMSNEDADQALAALRLVWGDGYILGYDRDHGWWVIKDGKIGSILTADSSEELNQMLAGQEGTGR